jgi:DNA-binding transcriptional LysR family regulator
MPQSGSCGSRPLLHHGIYALYLHSQRAPPRVRVFIDFLAEVFGSKPSWEKKLKVKLP